MSKLPENEIDGSNDMAIIPAPMQFNCHNFESMTRPCGVGFAWTGLKSADRGFRLIHARAGHRDHRVISC